MQNPVANHRPPQTNWIINNAEASTTQGGTTGDSGGTRHNETSHINVVLECMKKTCAHAPVAQWTCLGQRRFTNVYKVKLARHTLTTNRIRRRKHAEVTPGVTAMNFV